VHVGAGKLAMGLVIPSLLESDVPTVVLQTTRAPWNGVRASAARQTRSFDESRLHMSVQHRNKPIQSARLIFDDASAVAFASSKLDDKSSLNENTFIISDDFANVWAPHNQSRDERLHRRRPRARGLARKRRADERASDERRRAERRSR
jgi:hypothetical protein